MTPGLTLKKGGQTVIYTPPTQLCGGREVVDSAAAKGKKRRGEKKKPRSPFLLPSVPPLPFQSQYSGMSPSYIRRIGIGYAERKSLAMPHSQTGVGIRGGGERRRKVEGEASIFAPISPPPFPLRLRARFMLRASSSFLPPFFAPPPIPCSLACLKQLFSYQGLDYALPTHILFLLPLPILHHIISSSSFPAAAAAGECGSVGGRIEEEESPGRSDALLLSAPPIRPTHPPTMLIDCLS